MNIIDKWIERIRGLRKWSIMVIIIIIGIVFRVLDYVNGVEFVSLLKGIGVAFMASNAIEHAHYFLSGKSKKEEGED
jgi:hypothetical protein